jgi:hypothetical protein
MKIMTLLAIFFVSTILFLNRPYIEDRQDFIAEVQLVPSVKTVKITTKYIIDGVEIIQSKQVLGSLEHAKRLTYTNMQDSYSFIGETSPMTESTDENGQTVFSYTAKGTVVK